MDASKSSLLTTLNLSFHSDLLSSDYVEIHYEGGKPVLSKVMSPLVMIECIFLVSAEDWSWQNESCAFAIFTVKHTMTHRFSWSLLHGIGISTKGEGGSSCKSLCCGCQGPTAWAGRRQVDVWKRWNERWLLLLLWLLIQVGLGWAGSSWFSRVWLPCIPPAGAVVTWSGGGGRESPLQHHCSVGWVGSMKDVERERKYGGVGCPLLTPALTAES